ncbi:MAG: alpha/beta fold hydrolase [Spirochaetaceae bacterium]|nr:alpha/beta fold hydrolase [Spirochaetaceae bacterium]
MRKLKRKGDSEMVAVILVAAYIVFVSMLAVYAYRQTFCKQNMDLEYTKKWGMENGDFDQSYLDKPWQEFEVESPHGYRIACVALEAQAAGGTAACVAPATTPRAAPETAPIAIFVHGISWTRFGMYKYMKHFSARGWTVIAMDLPGHGATKAPRRYYPTFGHYEKADVGAVVDFVRSRRPNASRLGLVGESMGAGTVLEYAAIGSGNIDFVIADCPFSNSFVELDYLMREKRWIPRIVQIPALWLVGLAAWVSKGFWIKSIDPQKDILSCDVPVLFVHGLEDTFVPYVWSLRMYDQRKTIGSGQTEIFLVPGARHTSSARVDPQGWADAAFGFISRLDS